MDAKEEVPLGGEDDDDDDPENRYLTNKDTLSIM